MRSQYLVQFPFLQLFLVDGIPLSSCTVYSIFVAFLDDISNRERFPFLLLLPSESNFPQFMHCALLTSVCPNK